MSQATDPNAPAWKLWSGLVWILAAAAGFWDGVSNGAALESSERVQLLLLWITLAAPVAAGAAVAGLAAVRWPALDSDHRLAAVGGVAIAQLGSLLGFASGLIHRETAAVFVVASAIPLLAARVATFVSSRIASRASLGVLVFLAASMLVPSTQGGVSRSGWAALAAATLAAGLALEKLPRVLLRSCHVAVAGAVGLNLVALVWDDVADPARIVPADTRVPDHVVLIVLDTQRADHLGVYGNAAGLTPTLDALGRQSAVYDECFTASNWTIPSHASLFTGQYPQTHGASFEHHRFLDERFDTLAEALAARRYSTAAFVANEWLGLANLDQGFEHFEAIGEGYRQLALRPLLLALGFPQRFIDHGAADAVARIGRFLERRDGDRPLFLFVNLLEPHWRHYPPIADRLATLPDGLSVLDATRRSAGFYGPIEMARGGSDPATRAAVSALYRGAVRYQDRQLARLLALLDANLPPERTLLIVTSDHGENLGEAGRWDHVFALNDYLVHAVLMIRHRDFPAGSRVAGLCSQIDIAATISDVVGPLAISPAADARSLVPDHFEPRRVVFAAGDPYLGHLDRMAAAAGLERDVAGWNRSLRSARDGRYKYVTSDGLSPTGSTRIAALYDLTADPDESHDVIADHPEVAHTLEAALRDWELAQPRYADPGSKGGTALTPEELERLRGIGYVE